jgi:putative spermidine/putrescine transport system substrate-binding protein
MVNGEVALESMWSPAVAAIQAEGRPCVYAFPKEGMRGWHGGLSISAKVKGQLDQAYEYINWWRWLDGRVCRASGLLSLDTRQREEVPRTRGMGLLVHGIPIRAAGSNVSLLDGKPAAKDLPDPFGTIIGSGTP